ncbi:hypothetical protein ACVBEF_01625 [Glaciimonas sp. GG7]
MLEHVGMIACMESVAVTQHKNIDLGKGDSNNILAAYLLITCQLFVNTSLHVWTTSPNNRFAMEKTRILTIPRAGWQIYPI